MEKKLGFLYQMRLTFSEPVWDHYFALRCVPMDNENQKVQIQSTHVNPTDCLNQVTDGFGNQKYVGHYFNAHKKFEYEVAGTALVDGMKVLHEELHPMYKYPSAFTPWGKYLSNLLDSIGELKGTPLENAIKIMRVLHAHFTYVAGKTSINTTAEEALEIGAGVCQDYAHIMIALCRKVGIPARYVNGMMIGEGATHAWVEVYTGDGWYGLDPTNNLHVDSYYLKLAHGRDYNDCVVDKGRFRGNTTQTQEIYVNVEELR